MPYEEFAYWYDSLNQAADYDLLFSQILRRLQAAGLAKGIVADLGCGTGEISLRLAGAGYDVIAIDRSADMLSVLREKIEETGAEDILLLQQDIAELDLYGTVRAAVCTFDTLNHLPPARVQKALGRLSLFLEPGGLFVFDANTPYKHQHVLANNAFVLEGEDGEKCVWRNQYDAASGAVHISVCVTNDGGELFNENFTEYAYSLAWWKDVLAKNGFTLAEVCDGESFAPLVQTSERYLITAHKRDDA